MTPDIVFLIPILGISTGLVAVIGGVFVRPWLRYKERKLTLEATMVAEKAAQYAAQTERLEQRVRVLERIITDRGVDLSHEIEQLRDIPLN
jgi:ABC-type phosphate transport system auxiliary subunit